MFGSIGLPELLLIFVIALLLFGPRKLPEIGKTLGKAMNEFKRASNDLQRSLEEEIAVDELKQTKREVEDATRLTPDASAAPPAATAPPTTPPPPPEAKATEPK
ncbi:MAG TPA: TatA/E family twin arginine-targeting protein translocase [Thermoanaerobaculaceae bacterium]|nr:TatA/E family twin arginine-targeting protein translocase [Thermoanaerobaculaceae bacterium]